MRKDHAKQKNLQVKHTFEQILQARNRFLVRGNLFGGRLVFELQLLDLRAREPKLVGQLRGGARR